MQKEPLITAAVSAVPALAVAFGLDLTADQTAGILGLVAVAPPLIAAAIARASVSSLSTVAAIRGESAEPPA